MKRIGKAAVAMTGAALLCAASGPARAENCWSAGEVAAAKVRELQTMLMVAALRCRASGINILPSYNAFVSAHRQTITAMNDQLKRHFWVSGPKEGQRRYDSFTTALANGYGDGATGVESCREMAALSEEAAASAGAGEDLLLIADRSIPDPRLPGGACTVSMAAK